jgi:hypothetical protein
MAMSSKSVRPLAKLACICRSTEHNYTKEEAAAALKNGLRAFVCFHLISFPDSSSQAVQCFSVTTLDSSKLLPCDITVAFYGLWYLVNTVPSSNSEWHVFPLPKDQNVSLLPSSLLSILNPVLQIPTYHPESAPPKASLQRELPTTDQMANTPPLSKTVPIKLMKTPSPKKGKAKARYIS